MRLRQILFRGVIAVTVSAVLAALLSGAWFTALLLAAGLIAFVFLCRHDFSPRDALTSNSLAPWFDAMQGRDPFDPTAKSVYRFSGFATTFVVVLHIRDHPLLVSSQLVVFRDEIDDELWRTLVTHVRHGAHRRASEPVNNELH
jgi:hypothetical protein